MNGDPLPLSSCDGSDLVVKISGLNGRISDVSDIHRPPVKKQKRNEEMSGFSDITKIIVTH